MKHYLLYIPGLGDHKSRFQKYAVKFWRVYGIRGEFIPMNWHDGEVFARKEQRIIRRIDTLTKQGFTVSLMGTSAGGGAAVNAFASASQQLHKTVVVCATIGGADAYSASTYRQNPAFKQSMLQLKKSLSQLHIAKRRHILALQPLFDPIVYPRFARLEGAYNKRMLTGLHVYSIAYAITLGMPKTIRFIKRTQQIY